MVGQHALPYILRLIVRVGPKILCLHTPPGTSCDLKSDAFSCPEEKKISAFANKEMQLIYEELKFISDRMREEDKTSKYEDEWKYAAMVIDRLCAFVFFLGLFIAFTVTICVGASHE